MMHASGYRLLMLGFDDDLERRNSGGLITLALRFLQMIKILAETREAALDGTLSLFVASTGPVKARPRP